MDIEGAARERDETEALFLWVGREESFGLHGVLVARVAQPALLHNLAMPVVSLRWAILTRAVHWFCPPLRRSFFTLERTKTHYSFDKKKLHPRD